MSHDNFYFDPNVSAKACHSGWFAKTGTGKTICVVALLNEMKKSKSGDVAKAHAQNRKPPGAYRDELR